MNEITIPCSNCKQPIAESKHMLHETYCLRNNIKCPKCGVFYDKNDPDSHEEEYHKKEKCQYCSFETEDLKKHKCLKKPKQCMHCDLSFPADQLFYHETQCGSRTQKCDICNSYIIMREYQTHLMTCTPKPKPDSSQQQKKPTYQEIFEKQNYDTPKIDDKIDQQKFNSKKETLQQNTSNQVSSKQQVQTQQQYSQQQTRIAGSGYKYGSAAGESKTSYQLKDEDKNRQKDAIRPPSSNNQTGFRPQPQIATQGTQPKQQSYNTTYNQRQQNSTKNEEKTQFDNQYERQQYINKQSQQSQPQPQQQQKQSTQGQKSLESYKYSQNDKQQFQTQNNNNPGLRRPDTAIAREVQKQIQLEEEFGISPEEYLEQQIFNTMPINGKTEKTQPVKKTPPPQPVIPARVPQNYDNKDFDFDFDDITEEEKLAQQQIMESLKDNRKKR